jgi:hypothetical protein
MIVGILTLFASALITGVLFAQPSESPVNRNQPFVGNCERAIQDKVISNNPRAEKINFDQNSERQSRFSTTDLLIKGNGSFTRQSGEIENFSFECQYNARDNNVVRAEYSVRELERSSSRADTAKVWVQTCQDKVDEKIKTDHSQVNEIRFNSGRESQESAGVNKLAGEGEFVKNNGDRKRFTYECIYNMTDRRVTSSSYQPK